MGSRKAFSLKTALIADNKTFDSFWLGLFLLGY
jgi:hypothetical protein